MQSQPVERMFHILVDSRHVPHVTCTCIFIAWHRATAAGVFAPSKSRLFYGESFFSAIFPLSQKAAPIPPIVVFAMRKLKFQTFMCAVIERKHVSTS